MNNKNEELFNSLFNNRKNRSEMKLSFTEKRENNCRQDINFRKTINTLLLNINGEKPLIIYKKLPKKIKKIEVKKNNYMSDGGIAKKNKRFFNLITNYSCKKESKNKSMKENDNIESNLKNKRYKSLSLSNNKNKMKKNNFFEKGIKETNYIKNKNKSKGAVKYNLFLKNKKIDSEENEISSYKHINMNNEKNKEKQINKKNILINNLTKIKKYNSQPQPTKKQIQKFIFMGKKLEYLKANNIELSKTESNIENNEEKIIKHKNKNDGLKNKIIMKIKSENNKKNLPNKKQKPIIDQFEFIKKINIIHNTSSNAAKATNIFKYYNLIKTENKIQPKSLNINTYKNNKNSSSEETKSDDGYLFAKKKNYRKKEELRIFTKKKNSKEKKKKEENETEKTEKIYKKFKNLYKLNIENINFINQQSRKSLNINSQGNEQSRKRRVKNNYYIGIDGNKNDSTFIEPKDYYLILYQSKQLITNSNNDINDEFIKIEEKPKKKNNILNNMADFIKKLNIIFHKNIFRALYFLYFKKKYYNHYFLSIKFFIAIMKHYAFKKIYFYNISRKKVSDKKIIYLVEMLSLIFRIKIFEKIFQYCQQKEIKAITENIDKIFTLIKKLIFANIFKKIQSYQVTKQEKNNINNNIEEEIKEEIHEEIKEEIKEEIYEEIHQEKNEEINEEINEELNDNENIINNNLNNIYTEGLKGIINEINNTDEKNKKYKDIGDNFKFAPIKKEVEMNENPKNNDTNINFFNIIINNNINNIIKENEISDEKEINRGKFLDDETEENKEKNKLILNNFEKNKKNINEFEELFGEIKNMKSYSECSGLVNESKSSKDNNNNNKEKQENKAKSNKTNKNINISLKKEIKVINIIKGKKEEIKQDDKIKNISQLKDIIEKINLNIFIDSLTEKIIKNICDTEISFRNKLIPSKSHNYQLKDDSLKINQNSSSICNNNINKDLNSLGIGYSIKNISGTSLDKSLVFSSSIYSVFNKTIIEKKKELDENLFFNKILPKLIKIIKEELFCKYERIDNYIKEPIKLNKIENIVSIIMEDTETIINNYKDKLFKNNIDEIIQKKILLNKFNQVTNEIIDKYGLNGNSIYYRILNDCIVDSILELINKEKLYYNIEQNQLYSLDLNNKQFQIQNNNILDNKKKFIEYICKSLLSIIKTKIGNKSGDLDLLNEEKIKEKNEIKLNKEIKKEILDEDKENINMLKIEEMKIKCGIADNIFNILLIETIEILDNVQNIRKCLNNNSNKSIYLNEDIFGEKSNDYYGDFEDDIINY